jgi:hypothetical protein
MSGAMFAEKMSGTAGLRSKAVERPARTGLRIGEPDDAYEREADRVADEVMAGGRRLNWSLSGMSLAPTLQRKCSCGGSGSGECEECKKKEEGNVGKRVLQRKSAGPVESNVAPPIVHEVLNSPGEPLDRSTRQFFEPRFGYDFSRVRIHNDTRAAESAAATGSLAYTVGDEIVFAKDAYTPNQNGGRRRLAHELAHTIQQVSTYSPRTSGVLQRQAGQPKGPTAEFSDCDQKLQDDLRAKQVPALNHVRRAINALAKGWKGMDPADQALFRQYFDPAGSGEIDEGFVNDVRGNYQRILGYMSSLAFDCDPTSKTICGSGSKWCVGGRLMWTCFGALHICPNAYPTADDTFKIETMIHESVHNALHTTDREYATSKEFSRLKPRGGGILSFLSNIPVIGALFRLFRSNSDTLYNPDSYARFAIEL